MEYLTKQQIILLALLVSFVSSIATGIVTVSLMDQSYPAVTQTINRVVEKTIETVSPSSTTTKETIIVREYDAITDAIAKANKAIVRIDDENGFVSLGFIISSSGKIVGYTNDVFVGTLSGRLEGGNIVSVRFVSRDPITGISIFQAEQSYDPRNIRAYSSAIIADSDNLKLGQSSVLISGKQDSSVATGIISSKDERNIRVLAQGNFDSQAILVNLLGEVIGIKDGNIAENVFIPSNVIKSYAAN